jgi:hypothetical protein
MFGNRIVRFLVNEVTGLRLTDTQCGFQAFTAAVARRLPFISGLTELQEHIIWASFSGLRVVEVPVRLYPRRFGKTKIVRNIFNYGFSVTLTILRTYRDFFPLKFFGRVGGAIFGLGALLGLWNIVDVLLISHRQVYTNLPLVVVLLILVGLQIALFGFMMDGIRNYLRAKKV